MASPISKDLMLILVICSIHFCISMIGDIPAQKSVIKSPTAEFILNKNVAKLSTFPTRRNSFNSLRTYGHNSLLYNFQTYNEDLKYPKNRKIIKISNQMSSNSKDFFSNSKKTRFNYGHQLKIMLENCIAYENKRKFLSLEILGTIGQQSPGQGYNMLALKAAVEKEEEIMMGPKIGGVKHILKIATAMWAAIKQVNAAAVGRIPNGVAEEQMRFIGLVLAHLVFRDDPIVDPETGDYVFIARMEPSIDPIDPHVSGQIQKELDTQLRAQLACQELLVEEKDVGNVLAEKELFEILKNKVSRGISNRAEWAKWLELVEKFRLISLNHYKVPHFNLIFRTFIAFGDEAPKLILLVRVLLEGTIDEHQFDKYLETGSGDELLKFIHHRPSEMMSKQLKSLAKQFGFS